MKDSMLLVDGDFDIATGKRDNSDLPPDVRERVEPKKKEEVELDDENSFAYASGELDSTYMANLDSFAVDEEEEATLVTSMIDSVLLQQQIAELEEELQNVRDIKELERNKNRKGDVILQKIKIPNCRYLNDVYYVRDKFEFRYEYDFFLHYFDHRYFHKKKFYDMVDSTRIVAKYVMQLVGRSKYRHTDFNKVADSIAGFLPNYPVVEYLDSVITELNLEYLATGEIKIKYKGRRQDRILAKILPTKVNDEGGGSLGNIKFYTSNRRRVIEELDASQYDSLIIKPDSLQMQEKHLADSINAVLSKMQEQDSLQRIQDSLALLTNELAMDGSSKDSLHQVLDDMLFGQAAADSTAQDSMAMEEEEAPKGVVLPAAPSDPVSLNDINRLIKMLEAQRKDGKKGSPNRGSSLSTPSIPFSSSRPSILDNLNAGASKRPEPTAPKETSPTQGVGSAAPKESEPVVQPDESTEEPKESSSRKRRRKSKGESEDTATQSEESSSDASNESRKVENPTSSEEPDSMSGEEEQSSKKKKSRRKRKSSDEEDTSSSGEDASSEGE